MLIQIILLHGFDVCISIVRLNRYVIKCFGGCFFLWVLNIYLYSDLAVLTFLKIALNRVSSMIGVTILRSISRCR